MYCLHAFILPLAADETDVDEVNDGYHSFRGNYVEQVHLQVPLAGRRWPGKVNRLHEMMILPTKPKAGIDDTVESRETWVRNR